MLLTKGEVLLFKLIKIHSAQEERRCFLDLELASLVGRGEKKEISARFKAVLMSN